MTHRSRRDPAKFHEWKREQFRRQKGRCFYCECPMVVTAPGDALRVADAERARKVRGATVDHVVPLSAGGSDDPINRVLACAPCNADKYVRLPTLTDIVLLVDLNCVTPGKGVGGGPIARALTGLARKADATLGLKR